MNELLDAEGKPYPKTEVPPFESGYGRPDLDMLHQVVQRIDMGDHPHEVREMVAGYIVNRRDDTQEAR